MRRLAPFLLFPVLVLTAVSAAALAPAVPFGSHTWDVAEVFTNSDGTVQFIELVEANGTPNEVGLPGHTLSSNGHSFVIPGGPLAAPTSNKRYLIATAAFAALPGAPTPDAIIPAGSLPNFFSSAGDTVSYVPWDSWTFGAVPTDGVNSLKRNGTVSPNSPTNYAGASGMVVASAAVPAMPLGKLALLLVGALAIGALVLGRRSA